MKVLFFFLLAANLTLFGLLKLDSGAGGDRDRLAQQVQPDKIKLLTPQQVAALGPGKVAALADVCLEWGPLQDVDRARALSGLDPLDLGRLLTQKKVDVSTNFWVFIPPAANRAAADKRVAELKAKGINDAAVIDSGTQRLAISLGTFRTDGAAQARLAALQAQGVGDAKAAPRVQSIPQTMLVVRDPPAVAVTKVRDLQAEFPGTEIRVGSCERTT
jgi:sporulation related protein